MSLEENTISEFSARHEHCIATDGNYTDKEMVEILSNVLKTSYQEDLKWLTKTVRKLIKAFGGCEICYGKGYSTQSEVGRRIVPCTCERGKQIGKILKH